MKKIKYILSFLLAIALYSCIDTEEKIVINADQSGTYTFTIDMGKLIEMANQFTPDSLKSNKPKEKKDTIIYFKNMIDTAQNLTAQEKELYRDGYLKMNMDEAAGKMKIEMGCPFKNSDQLTQVKNNFFKIADKLNLFNKTKEKSLGDMGEGADVADKNLEGNVNPVGNISDFAAAPGKITNTINLTDEMKKNLLTDSTMMMMQQMTMMTGEMTYRTILVLPKAPKLYEGPGKSLSADGKTVTFSFTFTEMMDKPESGSYKVEY